MAAEDFIIRIVLDAQSKIAPVMASAAAEADKLKEKFRGVDQAAGGLDRKLVQLEGHVSKARDTFRSINPTLEVFDRKLKSVNETTTLINRNFGVLERNSAKAGAALGLLGGIVERLEKKLNQLDVKMTEMGARKYEPKMDVDTSKVEAKVNALIGELASATRGVYTAKTDVEIAAAMAKAEALRKELERLGHGDKATRLIFDIDAQVDRGKVQAEARQALTDAKNATREGFSIKAFLDTKSFNKDYDDARAKLFELANIRVQPSVHLGLKEFEAQRLIVEEQLLALGLKREHIKVVLDYDRGTINSVAQELGSTFEKMSQDIKANTEVTLRGIINGAINAAILFAEPLLSALTAVAGGLIAIGVAAGQAVAGLAGLATAAIAQGVPALGLLALAAQRFSAVLKVSQLLQAERDKGAQQSLGIDKSRANALDAVRAAHEGVANAQRQLSDAQDKLNEARRQGIRTLNDMILAEQRSQLTAQGSRLALVSAIARGDSGSLISSAQITAQEDTRNANRSRVDTQRAVAGGVNGLPAVVAATRAVADAQRALANAQRQVEQAQRGLDVAGQKLGAAANAYEIALKKLSSGERQLLGAVERFKKAFTDTGGAIRGVSDIITISLANALDRVRKLFEDPAILGAFTKLAKGIALSIDSLSKFFTSGPLRNALLFFTNEAAKNFGPLTRIIQGFITVFLEVARAASGPLRSALNGVGDFFERISKTAGSEQGQKNMRTFFEGSLEAMGSFLRLGGAIINLFLALAGPGGASEEGINGIDRLAAAINRAADYIEKNRTKVHQFFRDAVDGSGEVLKVIIQIGRFLVRTFDGKSLREFAQFINQVVLPVLTGFVIALGVIVRGLLAISNSGVGKYLFYLVGAFIGVRFVVMRVGATILDLLVVLTKVPLAIEKMKLAFEALMLVPTRIGLAFLKLKEILAYIPVLFTAIRFAFAELLAFMGPVGWIILIVGALTTLYMTWGKFREVVDSVIAWIGDHWKLVISIVLGPLGLIIAGIAEFGDDIIRAISGAFSGALNWVKDHWRAIVGIVGGPLGGIILLIDKFGGRIFGPFKKAFEKVKEYAQTAWNAIRGIFGGGGGSDGPQQGGLPTSAGLPTRTNSPFGNANFPPPRRNLGGEVDDRGISTSSAKKKKDKPLDFTDYLSASESKLSPAEATRIKKLWDDVLRATREKTAGISKAARDMRVAIEATLDRLQRQGSGSFDDLWKNSRHSLGNLSTSVDAQLAKIVKSFEDSMKSVSTTVYDAFKYVVSETSKTLKALGGDPIKITLDKPPSAERRAGGGFVGLQGERGGDTVPALIGRGEAVLNYAHQRVVEPAMQWFYGHGLSDMFKRNSAEHRGGGIGSGYAGGGFVNSPGAHIDTDAERSIASRLARLGRKLGVTFSPAGPRSARRTPSENVAVGGAQGSNHLLGKAMDVAPDIIKTIANSVLNRYGLNRPMPGNWFGTDGQVHDERNHIELLGTAISSAVNAFVDTTIKKIKVNGPDGALKSIASRAITKVRTAANTQLSGAETVGLTGPTASTAGGGGVVPGILAIARHAAFLNKVKWDERLTRILLQKESGGGKNLPPHNYGGILDPAGPFQIISSTFAANAFKGHGNRMNPEDNALAAFHYIKARYGSLANLARITGLLGDNYQGYKHGGFVGAIQQFAKGGVVQGAVGKAVPVIAHGGELILNKIQQSRLGRMMAIGGFVGADETPQERYLRILREEDQRRRQANENAPVDPKTLAIGLAFPIAGVAGNMIAGAVLARLASKNRLLEDPIEKPGLNPKYLNVGRAVQYEAFGTTNVGQVTGFHAGSGDPYIRKAGTSQERIISRSQVTIGKDSADAKRIVGLFQFLDEEHKKYSVTKRLADRDAKEAANEKARRKARKGPELFRGTPNTDPGKFELYDQGTGRRGPGTHASTDRNLAELYARPQGQFAYKSNTPGGGFIYSARLNPQAKGISWERADELPKEVVGEKGWERREHPTEAAKRHGYDFMEKGLYENGGKDSDIILLTEKAIAEPLSRARRAAQAASAAFKKTVAPIIEPISDYLTTRSLTKMYPETLRQLGNSFAASDIDRIVHDYPGSDEIKIYLKGDTGLPQHAYAAEGEGPGRATPKFEGAINDSTALKLAALRGEVENVKIPITERLGYNAQYYKNRLQERLRPIADKLKDEAGSFGFFNKQPENGVDAVIRKSEASQDSTREWKDGWKGTVYHGTSEEKHASILANGFDVNAAARARRGEGRGTVFFAHTPDGANYGPKRVEAKVHLKKPMVFWYDPEAPADTAYARERGRTGAMLSDPPEAAKLGWGSDELSQLAKKTGHDGAIYPRRDEMQVFDPAAIKRIKNYDPEANFKSNVVDKLGRFAGVAGKLTNRLFAAAAIKDVVTGHLLSGLTQAAGFIPGPGGLFASALLAAALHNNKNLPTRGPERAALDKRNYDAGRTGPAIGGGRLVHSSVPQHAPEPPPLSHFAQEEIKKRSRIKKAPYKGFKQRVFAAGGFNDEPAWDWGGWQKDGGTYLVNKPTLFGAGEAGPEIAHFASGKPGKGPQPLKVFESGLGDLATDFAPVGQLTSLIQKVFRSVKSLGDRGKKSLDKLATALDFLTTDATSPFKLLEDAIKSRAERAQRLIKEKIFRVSPTGRGQRNTFDPAEAGRADLSILNDTRSGLQDEADANAKALAQARRGLAGAKTKKQRESFQASVNKLVNQRSSIASALADNAQQIVERQEQMQRELLDASNKFFDGLRSSVDRARRVATALGTGGEVGRIDQTVAIAERQLTDLKKMLAEARKSGNTDLAATIQSQIDELNTTVVELGAQRLQQVVDDINANASKALGSNDLAQRFAAFGITQQQAQSGNYNIAALGRTDFTAQGDALKQRDSILRGQREALAGALSSAQAQGNIKVTEELTKQMGDLDASIVENTVAIRDNTQAAFETALGTSQTNSDFFLGANQAQTGILSALGLDTNGSLQQRGNLLQGRISSDKGFLSSLFNGVSGGVSVDPSALQAIGGTALAPFLSNLYQQAVDSSKYSDKQLESMRNLINGLLSNTQALIDNTNALQPGDAQNFSSTAWTVFRRAIFDGSGGLLPSYQLPHMAIGGLITKDGPIYAHAGEVVVPYHDRMLNKGGDTNVTVAIREADTVVDPVALGNRIAYTIKTAR